MLRFPLVLGCALILLSGCGGGKDTPPTVPVTGRVTFNDKPLDKGMITFVPESVPQRASASKGDLVRPASAAIQSDGTYSLSTFEPGDGILPGKYKVAIASYETPTEPEKLGQRIWLIPQKYSDAEKSGLTATIPADEGPQELDFELTGKAGK